MESRDDYIARVLGNETLKQFDGHFWKFFGYQLLFLALTYAISFLPSDEQFGGLGEVDFLRGIIQTIPLDYFRFLANIGQSGAVRVWLVEIGFAVLTLVFLTMQLWLVKKLTFQDANIRTRLRLQPIFNKGVLSCFGIILFVVFLMYVDFHSKLLSYDYKASFGTNDLVFVWLAGWSILIVFSFWALWMVFLCLLLRWGVVGR